MAMSCATISFGASCKPMRWLASRRAATKRSEKADATMSKPKVDIVMESPLWQRKPGVPESVMRAAEAVGEHSQIGSAVRKGDEICITLLDDKAIAELNGRWRGKNSPTNVLSFPAFAGPLTPIPRSLGDLAL